MGAVEDYLDRQTEPVATPSPTGEPDVVGDYLTRQTQRLGLSVQQGQEIPTEQAAKILRAQVKTGLPPEFLQDNLPYVESQLAKKEFDPDRFKQDSPVVADWLAKHPMNAAAAKDDHLPLGLIEKLSGALSKGWLNLQNEGSALSAGVNARALSHIQSIEDQLSRGETPTFDPYGIQAMTPDERAQVKAAHQQAIADAAGSIAGRQGQLEQFPMDPVINAALHAKSFGEFWHFFTQKPGEFIATVGAESAAQMLPGLAAAIPLGLAGGPAGAMVGMGAGSFAVDYPATVLQALQDEGVDLHDQSSIQAAVQDKELMGRVGQRAFLHAAPVALLDALSMGVAGKTLGPAIKAGETAAVRGMKQGVNIGVQAPVQGAMGATGEALGSLASGQPISPGELGAEFFGEFATAPLEVGAAGAATARDTMRKVAKAKETEAVLQGLGQTVGASKTFERVPESVRSIIEQSADGKNLFVPVDAVTQYFQSQDVSPREAWGQITGKPEAYDQAAATGADLELPIADYATKIAQTPLNEFFTKEVKPSTADMNAREADEWLSARLAEQQAQQAGVQAAKVGDALEKVKNEIRGQLQALGFDPHVIDQYAQLFASRYQTRAQRRGKGEDPFQLFQQQGITIDRPIADVLKGNTQTFQQSSDKPAHVLTGNELGDFGTDIKAWRKAGMTFYKTLQAGPPVEHPVLGPIRFTKAGKGKLSTTGADALKWKMLPALPDIIATAELKNTSKAEGRNDHISAFHWLENMVQVGDQSYRVGIHVAEDEAGNKFYNLNQDLDAWSKKYKTPGEAAPFNARDQGLDEGEETSTFNQSVPLDGGEVNLHVLHQSRPAPRGSITFGKGVNIQLLAKADLSTFLHETGHLYLNELIDDATTEGTSQQLRDDLDTILKWMGLDVTSASGKDAIKAAVQTAQHEQFARGFEAYALEGKSPSAAMREVFARFRQWLIHVYKLMTGKLGATPEAIGSALNVKLSNEVRKVMNRLIATEDEIQATEDEADVLPIFTDARHAGMSEKEFENYKKTVQHASMTARETLQSQLMAQLSRERQDWYKKKREEVKAQVTAEANQHRDYIALSVLQKGVMPDGSPLPDGISAAKLNKNAVAAIFGKDFLAKLPKGVTVAKEGISPEQAAITLGYDSAQDLLTSLANVRPKKELIEAETDHRMQREYGDPLIDGSLHDKARAAVMNQDREKVIAAELAALKRKMAEVLPFVKTARAEDRAIRKGSLSALMPPMDAVRTAARDQIGRTPIQDLKPYRWYQAAGKANRESIEHIGKEDYVAAAIAKQRELLNLELFRQATAALEAVDALREKAKYLGTKAARERIGKAGEDYLEQLDGLLERYEFTPISLGRMAERQSLRQWMEEKEKSGETNLEEMDIPEYILNEARRKNYRELTYDELMGLRDTISQIEHFAQQKNKLLTDQKQRDKDDARNLLIDAIRANNAKRPPAPLTKWGLTPGEKVNRWVQAMDASLLKMEQVVEWLDGGPTGPWHDYFWNPAASAQHAENDKTATITERIASAVLGMPKEIRQRMGEPVKVPGIDRPVVRRELLGVALNVGNESNQDKLLRGQNWTNDQLRFMMDQLSQEEWNFVQSIWDTLESMWPEIAALQKQLTGIEPEKVQIRPVQTKFGPYKGGYYPLMYSSVLSEQGGLQVANAVGKMVDSNYVRASLPSGHRKARTQGFAAPFDLDVDRLPSHIAGVVKDLTHRKWLLDANWIAHDKQIRQVLHDHLGEAMTLRMAEWVKQVANDRNAPISASLSPWRAMVEGFRFNTVIVAMGFKASTMLSQMAGIAPAIEVLSGKGQSGLRWFGSGFADAMTKPRATYEFMIERSGEMRHRLRTRDRDIREKLRELQGRSDLKAQIQEASLLGIGYAELLVSMPTWMGAYKQAIHAGKSAEDAVKMGDRAVRLSQGSGASKDLAAVATNNETFMRLITMFYTPFSALYGRLRAISHDVHGLNDAPRAFARTFWTVIFAATLGELLSGHGPDKDEDWAAWWARTVAMYPLLSIPLLRDAASTIVTGYGYQFSPIGQALETGTNLTRNVGKAVSGEKDWEDLAPQAVKAFSYLLGLPTSQLMITGKYLHDLSTGKADAENLFQFAHDFVYTRPKQ